MPEFLIGLIHLVHGSHENLKVDSDQGKKCGGEMHLALYVNRHVHPDESLVSQQVRTLAAEAQGWIDLFEQSKHVHVMYFSAKMVYGY